MAQPEKSKWERMKYWYRELPDKKRYLELVTAFLSIPVLMTVLITNTMNLQRQRDNQPAPAPAPTPTEVVVQITPTPTTTPVPDESESNPATPTSVPTPPPECKKGVGPVSISYPQENDVVSTNPVCVDISRQSSDYCSIVWSYRINNEPWSDYLDKSICLYGLAPGNKVLQLKIRSVVNNEETILTRNFTVADTNPGEEATASAN